MNGRLVAISTVLAASLLGLSLSVASCSGFKDRVRSVRGELTRSDNDAHWASVAAPPESGIGSGTWLKTGSSSETETELVFATAKYEQARVTMKKDTKLQTRKPEADHLYRQNLGTTYAVFLVKEDLPSIDVEGFGVLNPTGTQVSIKIEGATASIAVYEGSASFVPLNGEKSIEVQGGKELTVSTGGRLQNLVDYFFGLDEVRSFQSLGGSLPDIRTPVKAVDFFTVAPGSNTNRTTTLYNDGKAFLSVTGLARASGSSEFTYVGPPVPFSIEPGKSRDITIQFAAGSIGSKAATFRISSNDPDEASVDFSVSGGGAAPDIRAPISAVVFASVTLGTSLDRTATVYNDGNAVLSISGVTRVSGSSEFTYVGPAVPFNVGVGNSQQITIRFAPASAGSKAATFRISSNDPDEASIDFSVSADGALPPTLSASATIIDFGTVGPGYKGDRTFEIWNSGGGTLNYNLAEGATWLSLSTTSGTSAGEHDIVTVYLDASVFSENTAYSVVIAVTSNGGTRNVTVTAHTTVW